MLACHWATVAATINPWQVNTQYQVGWIVIPTLGYVFWHNREYLSSCRATGSLLGVAAATGAALAWIAGEIVDIALLRQLALLGGILSVVLAGTGPRLFITLLPSLALLLFLLPLGDLLLPPLKFALIKFIELFTNLIDLPFTRDGASFFVGTNDYKVLDACASLGYFLVGTFLALTFALLIYRSWRKIIALTLFGAAIALLANGLRVAGIVLYDHLAGQQLTVPQHIYFEIPALIICFALLFLVFSRLQREDTSPQPRRHQDPATKATGDTLQGMLYIPLAALIVSSGVLLVGPGHSATATPDSQIAMPGSIGDWQASADTSGWHPRIAGDGTAQARTAYMRGAQQVSIFVAQAGSAQDKVSGGALDLTGARGWMVADSRPTELCADEQCITVMQHTIRPHEGHRVRYVYTIYRLGEQVITAPLQLRMQRGWGRMTGSFEEPRLFAIMQEGDQPVGEHELATLLFSLQDPPLY